MSKLKDCFGKTRELRFKLPAAAEKAMLAEVRKRLANGIEQEIPASIAVVSEYMAKVKEDRDKVIKALQDLDKPVEPVKEPESTKAVWNDTVRNLPMEEPVAAPVVDTVTPAAEPLKKRVKAVKDATGSAAPKAKKAAKVKVQQAIEAADIPADDKAVLKAEAEAIAPEGTEGEQKLRKALEGLFSQRLAPRSDADQDAEYMAAVESGDMETAQRLVDAAARAAGYNVGPVYHGTEAEAFTVFDTSVKPSRWNQTHHNLGGAFFADDPAKTVFYGRRNITAYLKGSFLEVDALYKADGALLFKSRDWDAQKGQFIGEPKTYADIDFIKGNRIQDALSSGMDGVHFSNARDASVTGNVYWVKDPNQIKSADPVTRDESGNVIPLSKRFNPASDSILNSQPLAAQYRKGVPVERQTALLEAARALIEEGVITPDALAKKLTAISVNARQYSEAVWRMFGFVDPELPATVAWNAIYEKMDAPEPLALENQTDAEIEAERQRQAEADKAKAQKDAMAARLNAPLTGRDTTGQGALFADDPANDLFSGPAAEEMAADLEDGMKVLIGQSIRGKYSGIPFTGTVVSIDRDTAGGGFSTAPVKLKEPINVNGSARDAILIQLDADERYRQNDGIPNLAQPAAEGAVAAASNQTNTSTNDLPRSLNLEPNSGRTGTGDTGGSSGVPAELGAVDENGEPVDAGGTEGGNTGAGPKRSAAVPSNNGGSGRNKPVRQSASESEGSPSGNEQSPGSSGPDGVGVSPDTRGENAVDEGLVVSGNNAAVAASSGSGGVISEIRRSVPAITEEQAGDVEFAERRLLENGKTGVLLTNGTGTGKTFSGLGVVRRALERGAKHIIIVAPSDKIVNDWIDTAKRFFGITDAVQLGDTKDVGAGSRVVVTTYANFGMNNALTSRPWEMVVTDESHYLSQSKDGNDTDAGRAFRALTWHPRNGVNRRVDRDMADELEEMRQINATITANNKSVSNPDTMDQVYFEVQRRNAELEKRLEVLRGKVEARRAELNQVAQGMTEAQRPKAVFLSATPFAYHFSLEYAESYLFDFPAEPESRGYNTPSSRGMFYMENFGYRMRYGKLTRPENPAVVGMLERMFSEKLMKSGAMRGRALVVPFDYSRDFIQIESEIGRRVDEVMNLLITRPEFHILEDHLSIGNYLDRRYLLEAIKARESVERINQHLALGRNVVVFHDYKKGGAANPLRLYDTGKDAVAAYEALGREVPDLQDLVKQLDGLMSPLAVFEDAFPDAGIFNGDIGKTKRRDVVKSFNDSASNMRVALIQRASGKEGISLHDTDGKFQRVFIDLGIPGRPTDAIQSEGRIYRHGVQSNAVVEYLTTGTNFERWTFAETIAQRASTAENLAMGSSARSLLQSFSSGYAEAVPMNPSMEQGTGGKERDKARDAGSPFDEAIALYHTNQKKTQRTKAAEGVDYFATPEPLGYKMAEWLGLRPGEKALEPSAGHGAIARFFPDFVRRYAVEPSYELAGKLALNAPDTDIHRMRFEDYAMGNKFDGIAMNPPFGTAGKTAMDHLEKSVKHLRNGGRVVALIPMGSSMENRFNKWYEGVSGVFMTAEILLPSATFERAGTSVSTRIVILDKVSAEDAPNGTKRDLRDVPDVKTLFERLRDITVPSRPAKTAASIAEAVQEEETEPKRPASSPTAAASEGDFTPAEFKHTKTGASVFVAKVARRLNDSEFSAAKARATAAGGYYSSYKGTGAIPGFHFKTAEARDSFVGGDASLNSQPLTARHKAALKARNALLKKPELTTTQRASLRTAESVILAEEKAAGQSFMFPEAMGLPVQYEQMALLSQSFRQMLRNAGVDLGALDAATDAARSEKPGERTVGNPALSLSTLDPVIMGFDSVREIEAQTIEGWDEQARAMLRADYDGTVQKLMEYGRIGTGTLDPVMTRAAQMIVERESHKKMTPAQTARMQWLVWSYRLSGTEQARALGSRRDPFKTPVERHREFLMKAIYTPSPAARKAIENADGFAEKQRLFNEQAAEIEKVKRELARMGVSLDDLFSGEVALMLKNDPIIQNLTAKLDPRRKQAVSMIQDGLSFAEVAKATGLTQEAVKTVKNDVRAKFIDETMKKLRAMRERSRDSLKSQKMTGGIVDAAALAAMNDADAEAAMREIAEKMALQAGFIPDAKQGRMKKVKRKPLFRPPPVRAREAPAAAPIDVLGRPVPRTGFGVQPRLEGTTPPAYEGGTPGPGMNQRGRLDLGDLDADETFTGDASEWGRRLFPDAPAWEGEMLVPVGADLADVADVMKAARAVQAAKATGFDMLLEFWVNNLLSGPTTHIRNVAGNMASMLWDFTFQRGTELLVNRVVGGKKDAKMGEMRHLWKGLMPGISRGWRLAMHAWEHESDFFHKDVMDQDTYFEGFGAKGEGPKIAIGGKLGRVVRVPGRLLMLMDSLFKGIVGQMEAGAQAYRIATAKGLKGEEHAKEMRVQLNTPGSQAWQLAVLKAEESTFQSKLRRLDDHPGKLSGPVGLAARSLEHAARGVQDTKTGVKLLSLLLPFVRTPYNILRTGIRKSPIGAALLVEEIISGGFAKIKNGKLMTDTHPEVVKHLAEQMIAWTAASVLAGAAEGDDDDESKWLLITGTRERQAKGDLQERTFPATTIRLFGHSFNYGSVEPLATALSVFADGVKIMKGGGTAAEKVVAMERSFRGQIDSKTFLEGLSSAMETMQREGTWENKAKRFVLNGLVPNLIRQPLRAMDGTVRDPKDADWWYDALPLGSAAPPRVNQMTGADVQKPGNGLTRLLFPFLSNPPEKITDADRMLTAWNRERPKDAYAPGAPSREFTIEGMTYTLKPAAYDQLQRRAAALAAKQMPQYNPKVDEQTKKLIEQAFERGRAMALMELKGRGLAAIADPK